MKAVFSKRAVWTFTIIQVLGLACVASWESIPFEHLSFSVWIASILLLFPGDLLSQLFVEKVLWGVLPLPLDKLVWLALALHVAINALLWFGLRVLVFRVNYLRNSKEVE